MKKIFVLFLIPFISHSQDFIDKTILKAIENVDSNKIKAHVKYLADDKLKGRLPGKEGYQMAVDYVIKQYNSIGLKPAGDNGEFTQKVILRKSILNKNNLNLSIILPSGESKSWVYGNDFLIYPHPEKPVIDVSAPLVFVGAGFDRPEMGFKDYQDIDVKGKIVVVLRKVPDNLPANVKLHLNYPATTQEYAIKNGAIGILTCNYISNSVQFKAQANAMTSGGQTASMKSDGKIAGSISHKGLPLQIAGAISVSSLKELMKAEGLEIDKIWQQLERGEYVSTTLKSTLKSNYSTDYQDITSYNVVGKIEGSDAKLKNEYVIHSAHLDHIGVGKAVNGDSIYNGAHDNASGVACALETARIYARLKAKPKRSVLFVMVTAEEMGLLGSAYFASNPTVPKESIVADVNSDMPTIIAPLESIAPLGAEHSSLMEVVKNAANVMNLEVESDPEPNEGRFVRSDQYSFVKAGIPALHVKYGSKTYLPNTNLLEKVKAWREATYHKPADGFENGIFYWSAGRKYVQLAFLIGYSVAQNPERPTWRKGDFFEVK
jgi:hypothetical protein